MAESIGISFALAAFRRVERSFPGRHIAHDHDIGGLITRYRHVRCKALLQEAKTGGAVCAREKLIGCGGRWDGSLLARW